MQVQLIGVSTCVCGCVCVCACELFWVALGRGSAGSTLHVIDL